MPVLTDSQLAEIERLRGRDPDLHYEVHRTDAAVAVLSGDLSDPVAGSLETAAKEFIKTERSLFGISDADAELGGPRTSTDNDGWTHITFRQSYRGIPVWSGRVTVHLDAEREIRGVTNAYRPGFPETIAPAIDARAATDIARRYGAHGVNDRLTREPELVILPDTTPALAWVLGLAGVQRSYESGEVLPGAWLYFVDAVSGAVIRRTPMVKEAAQTSTGLSVRNPGRLAQVNRTLQTWHNDTTGRDELRDTVTGTADGLEILTYDDSALSWDDAPAPAGDNTWNRTTGETSNAYAQRAQYQPAEVDAHHFGGELYRFWRRAPFNRNSLNNAGIDIRLKTHLPVTYAAWDGSYINLGDADMTVYTFKGGQLDVLAHESTHAAFDTEIAPIGTTYSGQSGNAEESFCDIFGAFSERNWLFEELITVPPVSCLRNLSDPADPNAFGTGPDHFADYDTDPISGMSDAHTNCHILNYACYLMTHGGVHHRPGRTPVDIPVYPGIDWDAAERIYYRALTEGFTGDPGLGTDAEPYFDKVRSQVLLAAQWAYGATSCEYKTARLAFYAVGLQPTSEAYGPDVMITPWGDVTHTGPDWQSPDFFVRDAAGNPVEPLRGQHNRLFVHVRNIGDQQATGVRVRVRYAPYSTTYHHTHFKDIATSASFTLNAGAEHEVEVDWDMTNLDEDNGGLWPNAGGLAGIRGYDHFCVRAEIICESDVNACNNAAQNNFTHVGLASGDAHDTAVIITCPTPEGCAGTVVVSKRLPRTWQVNVSGVPVGKEIQVLPNKPRVARLKVTASPAKELEPPFDGDVHGLFARHGEFTAALTVSRYSLRAGSISGRLNGTVGRGRRFTAQATFKLVDRVTGTIAGKVDGHLLGANWTKHEPFRDTFTGTLAPVREVGLALQTSAAKPAGVTIRFRRT